RHTAAHPGALSLLRRTSLSQLQALRLAHRSWLSLGRVLLRAFRIYPDLCLRRPGARVSSGASLSRVSRRTVVAALSATPRDAALHPCDADHPERHRACDGNGFDI